MLFFNKKRNNEPLFPTQFYFMTEQIIESLINNECFSIEDYKRWKEFRTISLQFGFPLDIFRNIEYIFTDKELDLNPDDSLLDVGTGKSVFPRYLLRNLQIPLTICDYDAYGFDSQKYYFSNYDMNKICLLHSDAAKMDIADASFTKISAISAIEHFVGNKDSEFIKEAYRFLKKGGRLVVTVPYKNVYEENHNVDYYRGGFERRYNENALKERIFSVAPFKLKTIRYMNPQTNLYTQSIIKKHCNIGVYFSKLCQNEEYQKHHFDSIYFTLLLIKLDVFPTKDAFGCCFTLEKE